MNRQIVFISQVPQDTDILNTNKNAYLGLAKLAAAVLGTSTQINGLSCTATSTASMSVNIGAGEIYQMAQTDTSGYGSLPVDTTQILKQGINQLTTLLSGFSAPIGAGQSINYLIEFGLGEVDSGSTVLAYYNSENPVQPFSGPGNDVQPQNTTRQDYVAMQVKAGTAAATGSQTTPSPDTGYVGGWVVSVTTGQTTITSSSISIYPNAPFVGGSSKTFALDTSTTANLITVSNSQISSYSLGESLTIKVANTNTSSSASLNVNGLGVVSIRLTNGNLLNLGDLIAGKIFQFNYDGTYWELLNPATLATQSAIQNNALTYFSDNGAVNTYIVNPAPAIAALTAGLELKVKINHASTSSTPTLNVSGLGAKNITLTNLGPLATGDMPLSGIANLFYDGTQFQLRNPAISITGFSIIQNQGYNTSIDSGGPNVYFATLVPAVTSILFGLRIILKIASANTGASILSVNGFSSLAITYRNGAPLIGGELQSNTLAEFYFDGAAFQLMNPFPVTLFLNTPSSPGVSLSTSTPTNLVALPLPKGPWFVNGGFSYSFSATTSSFTNVSGQITTTSAGGVVDVSQQSSYDAPPGDVANTSGAQPLMGVYINSTGSTTAYLVVVQPFTPQGLRMGGTLTALRLN